MTNLEIRMIRRICAKVRRLPPWKRARAQAYWVRWLKHFRSLIGERIQKPIPKKG